MIIDRSKNFKVHLEKQPWIDSVSIWLISSDHANRYNYTIENGQLVEEKIDFDGTSLDDGKRKPLMILPEYLAQKVVDALTNTIEPTPQKVVDAELKATVKHLEDMRRLVFVNIGG